MTANHVSKRRFHMGEQNIFHNQPSDDNNNPIELANQTYTLQKETKQKLEYLQNELNLARNDLTRMGGGVVTKNKNLNKRNNVIFDGLELNASPIMIYSGE